MKISNNWLKSELQRNGTTDEMGQSTAAEAVDLEELSGNDTLPVRTLAIDEDSTNTAEEDTGVDPYNMGRFKGS